MHCAFAPIELHTRRVRVCGGSLDRGARVPGLQGGRSGRRHGDGGAGREAVGRTQLLNAGQLQERLQEEEGGARSGAGECVGVGGFYLGTAPTLRKECEQLLRVLSRGGEVAAEREWRRLQRRKLLRMLGVLMGRRVVARGAAHELERAGV
jgi:hypothetical protein